MPETNKNNEIKNVKMWIIRVKLTVFKHESHTIVQSGFQLKPQQKVFAIFWDITQQLTENHPAVC